MFMLVAEGSDDNSSSLSCLGTLMYHIKYVCLFSENCFDDYFVLKRTIYSM